jgi:adenine-specific DNA-methyltransferase
MKKPEKMTNEELITEVKNLRARKKYGLIWEDKPEDVVIQCKKQLPVLREVEKMTFISVDDLPTNFLIEGDNFHSISVLNYTHRKAIDVVYIDPPYNTGARDWKYNNNYVDSNDTYRHSKWISMMYNRLLATRDLLKDDGVLVVAIDDNEMHRLKMLLEEVFPGYDIHTVVVVQNPRGNITRNFARTHEYAFFVIPKGIHAVQRLLVSNDIPRKLRRWGHNSERSVRPTMFYPIHISKNGKIIGVGDVPSADFHPESKNLPKKDYIEIWPIDQNGTERRWNFGLSSLMEQIDRIEAIKKDGEWDLFITKEDTVPKTVWSEPEFEAGRNGATLVKTMTGSDFPFPKSIFTLDKTIEILTRNKKEAIILDYFAGSGTTGHAVMKANQVDGGRRRFILCTNNEGNIARDVTYPRIKKVIEGYGDVEGIPANLRYFKTEFVKKDVVTDDTRRELVQKATEMICVKEDTFEKKYDNKKYKIYENTSKVTGILYDLDAIDEFKQKLNKLDKSCSVYVFSLSNETFASDFYDLSVKHKLIPIPESILEVYRKLFS